MIRYFNMKDAVSPFFEERVYKVLFIRVLVSISSAPIPALKQDRILKRFGDEKVTIS